MHEAQETKVGRSPVKADSNDDAVMVVEHVAVRAKACADASRTKMAFPSDPDSCEFW